MTDVLIKRELLEDLRDCANECYNHARFRGTSGLDNYERLTEQADAILAAPRQPDGEGLEVVGLQWLDSGHYRKKPPKYGFNPHDWNELCRLSDAQRAIAERDATIERLEAGIPRLQEHAHQMRQQRDKLAGLLRDARLKMGYMLNYGEWYSPEELLERIDAALAEVKPCAESPHPAAT